MAKNLIGEALVPLYTLSKPAQMIAYFDFMYRDYTNFKKIIPSYQFDIIRMPY